VNHVSQILEEKGHDVLQIEADASVSEAVKQMVAANVASLLVSEGGIRHLPVVGDQGGVVGIVSIGDVVKFKSKQQSFEIKFLHEYIGAR
jgi:CBS domain-containing protein